MNNDKLNNEEINFNSQNEKNDETLENVSTIVNIGDSTQLLDDLVDESSVEEEEEEEEEEDLVNHDTNIHHIPGEFEGLDLNNKGEEKVKENVEDLLANISPELATKIVTQAEYYFSDENLKKDDFLRKHMTKAKKHFASLKLLVTFNRMKKLSDDYRVVGKILQLHSKKLIVSENFKKVWRVKPFFFEPLEPFEKCVLAYTLSSTSPEDIKQLFSQCGQVSKVEVFQSEQNLPKHLSQHLIHLHKAYHFPLVIVHYQKNSSPSQAVAALNNTSDWRRGMRVELMTRKKKKTDRLNTENQSPQQISSGEKNKKKKKMKTGKGAGVSSGSDRTASPADLEGGISIPKQQSPWQQSIKKQELLSKSYGTSPLNKNLMLNKQQPPPNKVSELQELDSRFRSNSFGAMTSSPGKWVPKRMMQQQQLLSNDSSTSSLPIDSSHKPLGVIRQPRGPNTGRGFKLNRTKA